MTAQPKVYADATALIGLARINRLDLLSILPGPTYVTTQVWHEATGDPDKPGVAALQRARDKGLLAVVHEGDLAALPELDPGEATVITAAAASGAIVIVDERKARALIASNPNYSSSIPQVIRVVGLILLAKRRGRIAAVRPLLDELLSQQFWLSPAFYQTILQQAGEA